MDTVCNANSTTCDACLGVTGPLSFFNTCSSATLSNIGIITSMTGSITTFTAPNGIIINSDKLSIAWNTVNDALPTGSLTGYISSLFSETSSSISQNARITLISIILTLVIAMYGYYCLTTITNMAYGLIDFAIGITLIFIGLFFATLTILIILIEISSFSASITFPDIEPVFETLSCALISGICCYSAISCCCPGGTQVPCKNTPG